MTSEAPIFHVSKSLNTSKTKKDIEKMKMPLRFFWKCYFVAFRVILDQWFFVSLALYISILDFFPTALKNTAHRLFYVHNILICRIVQTCIAHTNRNSFYNDTNFNKGQTFPNGVHVQQNLIHLQGISDFVLFFLLLYVERERLFGFWVNCSVRIVALLDALSWLDNFAY